MYASGSPVNKEEPLEALCRCQALFSVLILPRTPQRTYSQSIDPPNSECCPQSTAGIFRRDTWVPTLSLSHCLNFHWEHLLLIKSMLCSRKCPRVDILESSFLLCTPLIFFSFVSLTGRWAACWGNEHLDGTQERQRHYMCSMPRKEKPGGGPRKPPKTGGVITTPYWELTMAGAILSTLLVFPHWILVTLGSRSQHCPCMTHEENAS